MNNSVFGKTMENLRKRQDVKLVNSIEKRKKLVSKPNYHSMKIFDNDLVAIHLTKINMKLNRPIYCGFSILDNSKMLMYDFHYNYIQSKYGSNAKLLFTDTDSLCYEIKTDDIYQDMLTDKSLFDLSDYPTDSKFHSLENKKVIGKFKDETAMKPILEFVGLRAILSRLRRMKPKRLKALRKMLLERTLTTKMTKILG